nr:methyl-accepting chemotaxis protein [Bacillus sp. EAC]
MIRNLSTKTKIGFLVFLFIFSMSLIQLIGYINMSQMRENTEVMYKSRVIPTNDFAKYRLNNRMIIADMWQCFTDGVDENTAKEIEKDINARFKENNELLNKYKTTNMTTEEGKIIEDIQKILPSFETNIYKAIELGKLNENEEAIKIYYSEINNYQNQLTSKYDELDNLNLKISEKTYQKNKDIASSAIFNSFKVVIATTVVILILGNYIARLIVNPIKQLMIGLQATERGDLTKEVVYDSKDEIGILVSAYNQSTCKLREIINQIHEASDQFAVFSSQLSASAEQTSEASEHIATVTLEFASDSDNQVTTVIEASETIQGMVGQTQLIGNNSIRVNEVAKEAEKLSFEGSNVIKQAVEQMDAIYEKISYLNNVIHELGERSGEIGEIVRVITGIADQTNLLALNAAIEAARVGEHGKGFAVVAAEVRKLAEESAASASKISKLINAIQTEVVKAVDSMEQTTNQVEIGTDNVNHAGKSFGKIQASVHQVSVQIHEVSYSVQELVAGTEQMGHAIELINTTAQKSAERTQNISAATEEQLATMQEIAASSSALANLAEDLKRRVNVFTF